MTILAMDLGKFQSQGCFYEAQDATHEFVTIPTSPAAIDDLLISRKVDCLVIEVCTISGWVMDVATALGIPVQVANANHEGWRWKNVKRKTDRDDALKLARLSAMNQLPLVHVPDRPVRQWRSLIQYRHKLVERRTAICNSIHALLDSQGEPAIKRFCPEVMAQLKNLSRDLSACCKDDLWRGQLFCETMALEDVEKLIEQVEQKLDDLAKEDHRIKLLASIPGVGPRTAEMVVAWIDDPKRFRNGKQVGAYAGLTPRRFQSGQSDRSGGISRCGCGRLRKLLVQVAWGMLTHNEHGRAIFTRLCRGQKTRRKQAAVALSRRVLVWCWAMLRDNQRWDPRRLKQLELGARKEMDVALA